MGKLKFFIALWLAKLSQPILKLTKHNGTNFPGELAIKICPDFLKYIDRPEKIIAVTGTNGKTTVSNLICDLLERSGKRVLNNRAGSNINSGIATSLLSGCTVFNKTRYDNAVLEIDERSAKRIYPYMKPDIIVITNLFRDSIMRNAHPQYIADFLTDNIPHGTKLLLNADDLISSSVAPDNPRAYFGIEKMDSDVTECVNLLNDLRICPKCSGTLKYEYLRYHHIGRAYCEKCGFKSPDYNYSASRVDLENMTMTFRDSTGEHDYRLLSDSIVNVYNEVTLIALARELGMEHTDITRYLNDMRIVESRYNEVEAGDVTVIMMLAKDKNALACSRALDYISHQSGDKEIVMMMNCLSDEKHWSENITWMYDCDFEFMNRDDVTHIVTTGPRAVDYKLRLLIAGIPEERITCVPEESMAAEKLLLKPNSRVYILYGVDSVNMAYSVQKKTVALAKEAAH